MEKKIDETEKKYEETSKLSEERLKQALDAEAKIIELKISMQRLENLTYMAWFLQQALASYLICYYFLKEYGFACRLDLLAVCLKLKVNQDHPCLFDFPIVELSKFIVLCTTETTVLTPNKSVVH